MKNRWDVTIITQIQCENEYHFLMTLRILNKGGILQTLNWNWTRPVLDRFHDSSKDNAVCCILDNAQQTLSNACKCKQTQENTRTCPHMPTHTYEFFGSFCLTAFAEFFWRLFAAFLRLLDNFVLFYFYAVTTFCHLFTAFRRLCFVCFLCSDDFLPSFYSF